MSTRESPSHLRLVWSNPHLPRVSRVNFARAIERHVAGNDGLSDRQFVVLYATGRFAASVKTPTTP